jgi:hypothetical protein
VIDVAHVKIFVALYQKALVPVLLGFTEIGDSELREAKVHLYPIYRAVQSRDGSGRRKSNMRGRGVTSKFVTKSSSQPLEDATKDNPVSDPALNPVSDPALSQQKRLSQNLDHSIARQLIQGKLQLRAELTIASTQRVQSNRKASLSRTQLIQRYELNQKEKEQVQEQNGVKQKEGQKGVNAKKGHLPPPHLSPPPPLIHSHSEKRKMSSSSSLRHHMSKLVLHTAPKMLAIAPSLSKDKDVSLRRDNSRKKMKPRRKSIPNIKSMLSIAQHQIDSEPKAWKNDGIDLGTPCGGGGGTATPFSLIAEAVLTSKRTSEGGALPSLVLAQQESSLDKPQGAVGVVDMTTIKQMIQSAEHRLHGEIVASKAALSGEMGAIKQQLDAVMQLLAPKRACGV